jgi:hypothetical protein
MGVYWVYDELVSRFLGPKLSLLPLLLLELELIRLQANLHVGFCDLVDESITLRLLHKGWLIEL